MFNSFTLLYLVIFENSLNIVAKIKKQKIFYSQELIQLHISLVVYNEEFNQHKTSGTAT